MPSILSRFLKIPKIFNKPKNCTDFWDYENSTFQFHLFSLKSRKSAEFVRRFLTSYKKWGENLFLPFVYKGCGVKLFSNPTSCLLKSEFILALLILRKRQL